MSYATYRCKALTLERRRCGNVSSEYDICHMHRCPSCLGFGKIQQFDPDTNRLWRQHCYVCDGTGLRYWAQEMAEREQAEMEGRMEP